MAIVNVDSLTLFGYISQLRVRLHLSGNHSITWLVTRSDMPCRVIYGSFFPPIRLIGAYIVRGW